MKHDVDILKAALAGYEFRRAEIDRKIEEIKRRLGQAATPVATIQAGRPKRVLSQAARKRIAAAQKRRWDRVRRQKREAA